MTNEWVLLDRPPGPTDTVPDFTRPPLARLLGEARHRQGLTQAQVAARLGVTARAVGYWEAGRQAPRAERWPALGNLLGLNVRHIRAAAGLQRQGGRA